MTSLTSRKPSAVATVSALTSRTWDAAGWLVSSPWDVDIPETELLVFNLTGSNSDSKSEAKQAPEEL